MKKKIIIFISWFLVILWMGLIYYLSDMNGVESTSKSEKAISTVIEKTVEVTNEVGITNKNPKSSKISKLSEFLDYPARKLMHASVYFVLTILVFNAFFQSDIKKRIFIYSILFAFLYACTDEYHQAFSGRTSSFIDVLIDTFGSLIAILMIKIIIRLKHKKIKQN